MFELADDALLAIGQIFIDMMKKKIKEKIYPYGNPNVKGMGNKVASGKLLNSLSVTLVPGSNGEPSELQITYQDYFKYVNLGRKTGKKRVPTKDILEWIKIRGIRPRNKKGQFIPKTEKNELRLAYAIQTNIFKYGIRPANIYDKGLDSLEDIFNNPPPELREAYNDLYAAIENDVANFIESNIIEIEIETPR
jgi:hypothetical protein